MGSAERASHQLERFPAAVREVARSAAAAELYEVDHPPTASENEAYELIGELDEIRGYIEHLPLSDKAALDRLGSKETRALVTRLKPLLLRTEPDPGTFLVERGQYLDQENVAFILALCVYLEHRDTGLWRRVDQRSSESAKRLANIIAREAPGARFRAMVELSLYPKSDRASAADTESGVRSIDATTRKLSSAANSGRAGVQQLISQGDHALTGRLKLEIERWASARYAQYDEEHDDR